MVIHINFGKQVYKKLRWSIITSTATLTGNIQFQTIYLIENKSQLNLFFYKFKALLGGVYSLFIGLSFITFLEIFYFFTIRLWANYRKFQNAKTEVNMFSKRLAGQKQKMPLSKFGWERKSMFVNHY